MMETNLIPNPHWSGRTAEQKGLPKTQPSDLFSFETESKRIETKKKVRKKIETDLQDCTW